MRNKRTILTTLLAIVLSVFMGTATLHASGKKFVRLVDNFIILFDASATMDEPYKNTKMRKIEAEKKIIKDRISDIPELGYNVGLYTFVPKVGGVSTVLKPEAAFTPFVSLRPWNKKEFVRLIDSLPSRGKGPTMMNLALANIDRMLAALSGRTAIFVFTDGKYADVGLRDWVMPAEIARGIAMKYNACFYVISSAEGEEAEKVLNDVAAINECSHVITFDELLKNSKFIPGALFVPKK